MSDIYRGIIIPVPPAISDDEKIDRESLFKYIQQLSTFHQDLLYKMNTASFLQPLEAPVADTDETKFSNKIKVMIDGVEYYVMLTKT